MELVSEALSQYCLDHSTLPSGVCEELEAFTQKNVANPRMLSGPLVGSFLGFLIGSLGAKRILEVGTYTGYSALYMAERLAGDGKILTLDKNPESQTVARRFWDKSPAGKKIEALSGDARDLLKTVKGPFDFAFIDADKGGYLHYLKAILPLLSPKGVVVADNTLWSGRVLEGDGADADTKAIQAFNDYVAESAELESCLLPVRDGLHLIRKRA